ncbi:DNA primase [Stenotrophomonas terrae]|uniref:DNA primase n=1 Tax=Stenotrophomonas terrae TaxID=405446 RepID=A0A0R0CLT2_9GAMM|nr:DNA primase [Stenotrophomonas terrae]
MNASNYGDVCRQLAAAGLVIPSGGLRITGKPVRVLVVDGGREKRGWYLLKEWAPSTDRLLLVGSFGIWHGNDNGAHKVAMPEDDGGRITPEQAAAMRRVWADAAKAAEKQRKEEAEAAAVRATKAWARLHLDGESPYLQRKGVLGYGLKFTQNNTAVVPLGDIAGKIHGLQFLRSAQQAEQGKRPEKEFWPAGLIKKGHFHLLGHTPHWIVLIAEGYATAASLHAATGYPVVCAFDAGNLQPVAEAIRKRYKLAKVLICADDDILGKCRNKECRARIALPLHPVNCPECGMSHGYKNAGIEAASTTAMAVGGEWMPVRFTNAYERIERYLAGKGKDSDFNDLHALEGLAAVGGQVQARLSELKWAPPALRAVSSSKPGERGGKLKPIQNLDELLRRYSLIYSGGGAVFDHDEHCLLPIADMKNACVRPELHKAWMEHADRDIVRPTEVGFDPACEDKTVTCNLWGGWPTTPVPGKCQRLIELLQYLCSEERNSRELFQWVLRWCAYPIQHPGAKMKSTVVVHGGQGAGKNMFFEAVMSLYGQYGSILDQNALVDKHNDWASRKLFLIADEVVAQAHRFEQKNLLKVLVTGTKIRINPKHIAAYDEVNHLNLVFLSNEQMPVVLEKDDRRHCIIWTPPKREPEYYRAIMDELANGGLEAFHDYLLNVDLGDFDTGTLPPRTKAKDDLVQLAQDSPVDFIEALSAWEIPPMKPMPGLTEEWFQVYQRWCANTGVKPASMKRFVSTLEKRCNITTTRKGHQQLMRISNPLSTLLFGHRAPEGQVESAWLGEQILAMRNRKNDYFNGNRTDADSWQERETEFPGSGP